MTEKLGPTPETNNSRQPETPEQSWVKFGSHGGYRLHQAREITHPINGPLAEVDTGKTTMRLMPDEWGRLVERRQLTPFDIMAVQPGDILELADGRWLKITENQPTEEEVTFEVIESGEPTNHPGQLETKPYDRWRTYQDQVKDYLPGKLTKEARLKVPVETVKKPDDPATAPVVNETPSVAVEPEPMPPAAPTMSPPPESTPEPPLEPPPAPTNGPEPAIIKEVEKKTPAMAGTPSAQPEVKPTAETIGPLGLTAGQTIWTTLGEAVKVIDVVTKPETNQSALKDGYVVLGFNPKPGRNDTYQEEIVPFYKIERQKKFILLESPVDERINNQVLRDILQAERKFATEARRRKKWWQFWR